GGISAYRKPRIGFVPRTFLHTYAAPPLHPFPHNHPAKITSIFAAPQYTPCNQHTSIFPSPVFRPGRRDSHPLPKCSKFSLLRAIFDEK
ncbi:hypothetical protein C8R44DRAFT_795201, partial [Mycena epipterygia]